MRISTAFPSDFLRAADLQNQNVTAVISAVEMKDIGGDHKPVVYFQGKEKGLVLNKTNANNIAAAYGDDTDNWIGGELVMYPAMVDFQGRSVEAIRVRIPPRRPAAAQGNGQRPVETMTRGQVTQSPYAPHPNQPQVQYDERNPPPVTDVPF